MSQNGAVHASGQTIVLLSPLTIAAAVAATATSPTKLLSGMKFVTANAIFLYGADGTTAKAYVQTSLDGTTWIDIMSFAFTTAAGNKISSVTSCIAPAAQAATPTDGSLTDNTIIQGTLGRWLRLKYVTTGTYSGATSLAVYAIARG